jgi:hypothetical protein
MGTRFVRHWLTGELQQVPSEGGGIHIIGRTSAAPGRRAIRKAWQGGHVSRPLSLKPEDCTPERIAQENAEAKAHGTGAFFTPNGLCHLDGRENRKRELRRQRRIDMDGGYGD